MKSTADYPKKKIMLVDDNAIFRLIFANMVQNFNSSPIDFISFESPIEALSYLNENFDNPEYCPDFLFVDINMPFMTGWEMMDQLKINKLLHLSNLNVYMISSSSSKRDMDKQHEYNFIKGYVQKPTDAHTIHEIIENQPEI